MRCESMLLVWVLTIQKTKFHPKFGVSTYLFFWKLFFLLSGEFAYLLINNILKLHLQSEILNLILVAFKSYNMISGTSHVELPHRCIRKHKGSSWCDFWKPHELMWYEGREGKRDSDDLADRIIRSVGQWPVESSAMGQEHFGIQLSIQQVRLGMIL